MGRALFSRFLFVLFLSLVQIFSPSWMSLMGSNTLDLIRSKQFWIFQLLGWSTWVLMLMLRDIIVVPPEYIFSRALVSSASAVTAMLLTAGLRTLYKLVWERGFIVRFLVTWFGSFGAALIWQPI